MPIRDEVIFRFKFSPVSIIIHSVSYLFYLIISLHSPCLRSLMLYQFPFELVEAIVAETWLMPLTPRERIVFMTSAPLVNRAWLAIYSRISHRNVHIPSPSYFGRFLAMLSKDYPLGLCQSITFSTDIMHCHPYSLNEPLINLLYTISPFRFPNLHTLSLIYISPHSDEFLVDLADAFDIVPLPPQITSLKLTLADPVRTPDLMARRCLAWPLPSVTHLTIRGATELAITDLVSACTNLSTLSIESDSTVVADLTNPCPCDAPSLVFCDSDGGAAGTNVTFLDTRRVGGRHPSRHPGTHLSIKLHSHGSKAEYWDGIETSRWEDLSVFQRYSMV